MWPSAFDICVVIAKLTLNKLISHLFNWWRVNSISPNWRLKWEFCEYHQILLRIFTNRIVHIYRMHKRKFVYIQLFKLKIESRPKKCNKSTNFSSLKQIYANQCTRVDSSEYVDVSARSVDYFVVVSFFFLFSILSFSSGFMFHFI